jgi:hypothetical protein
MRIKSTFFVSLWLLAVGAHAADPAPRISINALLADTQQRAEAADTLAMVWWIPEDFWRASINKGDPATAAQAEAVAEVFRPYVVVLALDGVMGALGGVTYKSEPEIRAGLKLIDSAGTRYSPLDAAAVSEDVKSFMSYMQPMLARILGPLGDNMHFFYFPSTDKDGRLIADPHFDGVFNVAWSGREFRYRLPLASLVPPRVCPVNNEQLNGTWRYCPWHGAKLLER